MRFDVHPNKITYFSAFIGILSGYLIGIGRVVEGVVVLFVSQIFDCVDGDLARMSGRVTKKGAYIDRVLDRFVDAAIIIGIVNLNPEAHWFQGFLALTFSFGVSITRVMAEATGIKLKAGIAGRDTRIVIVMLGLLLGYPSETLWVLALLSAFTTLERIYYALKKLEHA
ncbi:CDP-alcohol phosphatidyltransferase family protein [Ferroglobus sp.]|uniref:CDP-alcohol phosphatidyltransferase family protein n=1 Tax=Ferroglobus sp. TaxID=2614230 RepID=UPI0025C67799|nr:CDP-alcohol phosphatidyltransferase family protein [Ferroglobus sp.]